MLKKIETIPSWLTESAEGNLGTLWQIVKAYRANRRQGTVGVKTRSMVRSTGKKPYGQKKTGQARRGSFVSPLHVGGGVAHGPKARDYRQALPEKMAHQALKLALAKRMQAGLVFEGSLAIESGKTKDAATMLKSVGVEVGKVVVCLSQPSEQTIRAYRNIRGVVLVSPSQLTALDVMESRNLVVASEALKAIEARISK
jgi:large subunit ribosomal protein L4